MKITGSVDGFVPPNTVIGWASATPAHTVTIRVARAGQTLGEGPTGLFRKDLGSDTGFRIDVTGEPDPLDLATGNLVVSASTVQGLSARLPVWEGLLERLFPLALEYRAKQLPDDEWRSLLDVALQYADGGSLKRLEGLLAPSAPHSSRLDTPDIPAGELSGFGLLPGIVSPGGIAVVGRNGHLFIVGGGNNLLEQYRQDPKDETCTKAGDAWIALFHRRRSALGSRGIRYAQLVIPEKSSVLPDSYPVRINTPTPLSMQVRGAALADPALAGTYCDLVPFVTSHPRRTELFRRLDSHLSPFGCHEVFAALLANAGWPLRTAVAFTERTVWSGDLVEHFPGWSFRETVHLPERASVAEVESALVQTAIHFPGYHNGMYASWKNPEAPSPLRVIVFGNSFFGIGDTSSLLSWWAARWFREFHFRWRPDFDYDFIDQIQPDLVIGQTVERFLPVVPTE